MKKTSSFLSKTFLIIMAIITLFPFVYMVLASLMTFQEATSAPPTLIPQTLNFSNYSRALEVAPFGRYFLNTVFTALSTTTLILITSILAGFALVSFDFKGKNILTMFLAALLMVPYEITVFTNFQTIAKLGLIDSYAALILPHMASIFYIFYLKGYLQSIPSSYYKAAKVDGCSDFEYITKVMVPMAKPALFTMGILNFIAGWNSFLWPILVTNSKEMRLISNGLSAFSSESGTQVHLQMAGSTIAILPILILYLIFRKQIMGGVGSSGLKV